MLNAEHIVVRYGAACVVDDVSLSLHEGEWLMLCGPNGAGKSTFVRALSQGVPYSGRFTLMGENMRGMRPGHLARRMGVLSQFNSVGYAFTVRETIALGRYAYSGGLLSGGDADGPQAVEAAIDAVGLNALADHSVLTLSGGETQRVFLAQVLAQQPLLLVLDEPANHLDLIYQKEMFSLISEWLRTPGRAVISVVHDLSLARMYGTHALMMNHGQTAAQGTVSEVMTPQVLREVYQMDVYDWMRGLLEQWQA